MPPSPNGAKTSAYSAIAAQIPRGGMGKIQLPPPFFHHNPHRPLRPILATVQQCLSTGRDSFENNAPGFAKYESRVTLDGPLRSDLQPDASLPPLQRKH